MRPWIMTALAGIGCVAVMGQSHAGLVIASGPSPLTPGSVFEVSLAIDQIWPLDPGQVIDQIEITLHFDGDVLQFQGGTVHPGGLLDSPDVFVPVVDVISDPMFIEAPSSFGPGSLTDYRFLVLPLVQGSGRSVHTAISADVIPSMGLDEPAPLTDLAPASLAHPSLSLEITAVPEPSPWLATVVGFGLLFALRARALTH